MGVFLWENSYVSFVLWQNPRNFIADLKNPHYLFIPGKHFSWKKKTKNKKKPKMWSSPLSRPFAPTNREPKQRRLFFERRTSTRGRLFAFLGSGFTHISFIGKRTLSSTILVAFRYVKWEKASLQVDVRRPKTSLLKFPNSPFSRHPPLLHALKDWWDKRCHVVSQGPNDCWN